MLTTAKSIQLLDASGMNISPITDITSLYYETPCPSDERIITRKYIYDEFPIGINIDQNNEVSIGTSTGTGERHPENNPLYKNGELYKIIDSDLNDDILVSNVSTYIMKGTTLREIKVKNYNLSEILSYYTPLDLMDASCQALDISINNINSSIDIINSSIYFLKESLDASSATLSEIINWGDNNTLIPNKFYLINDYYVGGNGCMALPNPAANFSGPDSSSSLSLLVKVIDASTLDGKLYEMYDHSGNALKVYGTYKLEDNKVHITYMKDQYGNEAPYDFYNLKYNGKYTYNYAILRQSGFINLNNLIINPDYIKNNIIKINPYTFNNMPIIDASIDSSNQILNNYFGYDSFINIGGESSFVVSRANIINNFIGSNVSLYYTGNLENTKIYDNNIITNASLTDGILKNVIINSNNNIIFKRGYTGGGDSLSRILSFNLNNLIVNSSNNISIILVSNSESATASNVTILNNCNGSINLSDNIIVDNYIDPVTNSSLNTSPNSVYLFGQDVYAKSFNTLQPPVERTLLYLNNDTVTAIYDTIIDSSIIINAIGNKALLKKCEIGNNVIIIDNNAFYNCANLTSVTIGNSVTTIDNAAFSGCSSLTSINIPNSVTSINGNVFYGCSGLTSITVDSNNQTYDSRNNCNAIIETNSNKLISGCQTTVIPNTVTIIGDFAFYYCSSLTSINIPDSVTSIGNQAFQYCSGLTSINIPNLVTSIGGGAFQGCSNLTSATIGNSVTRIDAFAFSGCSNLTSITVDSNIIISKDYDSQSNIKQIFGEQVTEYIIGNSVNSIGNYVFDDCSNLTSVTIGNSVTSIGHYAFQNCSSLTSINIPNSVTWIGDLAFAYCNGLTSITIPNSVTYIGDNAFNGCSSLTSITSRNTTPPTLNGSSVFDNTNDCSIYVPSQSVEAYKTAQYWSEYEDRIQAIQ